MDKRITDLVAYLTPIGLIVALVAGDRKASRFHLNQALVLWIVSVVLNVLVRILRHIPLLGILVALIGGILDVVLVIFWLIGLISAARGSEWPLPVLGSIHLL